MHRSDAFLFLFPPVDSNTFVRLYELCFKNPFAPVPTFSFLRREHLKQIDKWRPRGRLHSDGQVSYWARNNKTLPVAEHCKLNVQRNA